MKVDLVRYCPGSAPGSPAWMPRAQAEEEERLDSDFILQMCRVNAIPAPVIFPHIGGTCARCLHKESPA